MGRAELGPLTLGLSQAEVKVFESSLAFNLESIHFQT